MPALDLPGKHVAPRASNWIPWVFVLGFITVITANGALIYYALHSWAGLSDESAFEHGRTYNQTIDEADRQALLGWKLAIEFRQVERGTGRAEVTVTATDRAGAPVGDLRVEASIERPVGVRGTVTATLAATGNGTYAAVVDLPQRGQWDVHVAARRGGSVDEATRRVFLP